MKRMFQGSGAKAENSNLSNLKEHVNANVTKFFVAEGIVLKIEILSRLSSRYLMVSLRTNCALLLSLAMLMSSGQHLGRRLQPAQWVYGH